MGKQATLKELQTYYDLGDVLDLHEIMDIEIEANEPPPQSGGRP